MATITVPLPEEDLIFLRAYSEAQGISPEAYLARQARNLREQLGHPPHPEVTAATGVIQADVDAREVYQEHLAKKHA